MASIHAGSLSRPQPENGKYGFAMQIAFATAWLNCQRLQAFLIRHISKACQLFLASRKKRAAPIRQLGIEICGTSEVVYVWYRIIQYQTFLLLRVNHLANCACK